jgi:hypothetical protein
MVMTKLMPFNSDKKKRIDVIVKAVSIRTQYLVTQKVTSYTTACCWKTSDNSDLGRVPLLH